MSIFSKNKKIKFSLLAGAGFIPLTNFPAFTSYTSSATLAPFINTLYTYTIGIAAILAVVEIIWGGFLWMGSGASVSNKETGRNKIIMSIFGLILVLSPYIILSLISPSMLSLKLGTNNFNINPNLVSSSTIQTTTQATTTPAITYTYPCTTNNCHLVSRTCLSKYPWNPIAPTKTVPNDPINIECRKPNKNTYPANIHIAAFTNLKTYTCNNKDKLVVVCKP